MENDALIYVAGHKGLVGSAIVRRLKELEYTNIIGKSHNELDLTNQNDVSEFFKEEKIEYVFLAAAKVGGINANQKSPAQFFYENSMIENNIIHNSYLNNVKKLLFLGSSCIYPKESVQPIKEEYLLSGYLEVTNEAYAIAKIAGLKMCQYYNQQFKTNFISAMPTNLYGPNDSYDLENSHVLPALIRKFHEAKLNNAPNVELWGTGKPMREFLHVDDLADAVVFLMNNYEGNQTVNVGVGEDISIKDLGLMIKEITEYEGDLIFDTTKPDGTFRKLLDVSKLSNLGWRAKISLYDGISETYNGYVEHYDKLNK
ncbi:MAG: GDP-L-fucose synthase [Methanobrevibacter sp.]|jgi:GDP-L-fucose synthase|nr:GDP-L-fucose synthase [Candidatus Methanoflexus mossambicus]